MPRTHGLTALAILHHVTAALALLALTGRTINPAADNASFVSVMQVCAFAFFTVIVRRAWAGIDGGANGLSPAKVQGFLFIPFFNFYWVFPALVSLATQTNAKADSSNVSGGKLTRGFGLVIAILFCVTSLTDLHASLAWLHLPVYATLHASLAWLHLLVYATYVGFTVTYIWQIRRAAAAFDAHTAPALSEPTKMPTVGIAGIIYGAGVAALLLAALGNLALLSPEAIKSRLEAKGYTVKIDNISFAEVGISKKDQDKMEVSTLRKIEVVKGRKLRGSIYAMDCSKPEKEVRAGFKGGEELKPYYTNHQIFFAATIDGDVLDFEVWLSSF